MGIALRQPLIKKPRISYHWRIPINHHLANYFQRYFKEPPQHKVSITSAKRDTNWPSSALNGVQHHHRVALHYRIRVSHLANRVLLRRQHFCTAKSVFGVSSGYAITSDQPFTHNRSIINLDWQQHMVHHQRHQEASQSERHDSPFQLSLAVHLSMRYVHLSISGPLAHNSLQLRLCTHLAKYSVSQQQQQPLTREGSLSSVNYKYCVQCISLWP